MSTIPHERLRTPVDSGAVLVEPPVREVLREAKLPEWAARLRRGLRARLGFVGPLIVTGHQCELFHAGVFAKSIAARRLAERVGGDALFVHVDSDTPKSISIGWPSVVGRRVVLARTRLPGIEPDIPIELHEQPVVRDWARVFRQLEDAQTGVRDSLLHDYVNGWSAGGGLAERFVAAHRATESALRIAPLRDVTLSELAETPEFGAFAARLILDAAQVSADYNAAQAEYRRRHRVRNAARPVPLLETLGGRIEAPLWIYRRDGDRRRQRLFVEARGAVVTLFAGAMLIADLDRAEVTRVANEGGAIAAGGWMVRPRALALSAFCRLVLADVFIHGIGGAKYDEVTDAFIRGWLGVNLPPMLCVSATLRLPIEVEVAEAAAVTPREVRYNPQRVLRTAPTALVERRAEFVREGELLRQRRATRRERRRVFDAICAVNSEIVAACRAEVDEIEAAWQRDAERREDAAIAADREVFYAMHSRQALLQVATALSARIRE